MKGKKGTHCIYMFSQSILVNKKWEEKQRLEEFKERMKQELSRHRATDAIHPGLYYKHCRKLSKSSLVSLVFIIFESTQTTVLELFLEREQMSFPLPKRSLYACAACSEALGWTRRSLVKHRGLEQGGVFKPDSESTGNSLVYLKIKSCSGGSVIQLLLF